MTRWWAMVAGGLLAGCSEMVIDGEVVDARGQPVVGASVTAAGTVCSTATGADGGFALACEPGTHTVVVSAPGFTSEEFTQAAPETENYDSGRHLLVRVPKTRGLHLFVDSAYESMKPGRLSRTLTEAGPVIHRAVCLDRDASEANPVAVGAHTLFDYEHPGWRPFRLDDEGCAFRDRKDAKHRWTEVYKDKPPYDVRTLNEGKSIATVQLAPGDYFIADWKGFFVGADEREARHSYTGYWLHVE